MCHLLDVSIYFTVLTSGVVGYTGCGQRVAVFRDR